MNSMEVVVKIKANEFSDELVQQIKSLMPTSDYTVTISISNNKKDAYFAKLDEAIEELENNEGSTFTLKSFEEFIRN
jgi:hypothetical protein